MTTKSILRPDLFRVVDEETESVCYGFNQIWYKTRWQRLSGCGPSVVSGIICYLNRARPGAGPYGFMLTKRECRILMEEVWKYVTPTLRGIPSTEILCKGAWAYIKAKGLDLSLDSVDVAEDRSKRPGFPGVLAFIGEALSRDTPVAFLNLSNGGEKRLDPWHWVTIISLSFEEDASSAVAEIIDDGRIKKIDLALWFQTTTLGGGFVSFNRL